MTTQPRHPAGSSRGGQFTPRVRTEDRVSLHDPNELPIEAPAREAIAASTHLDPRVRMRAAYHPSLSHQQRLAMLTDPDPTVVAAVENALMTDQWTLEQSYAFLLRLAQGIPNRR